MPGPPTDGAILALDVGTSSCRASLYDLTGRRLRARAAHLTYSPTVTPDGGADLDPDALVALVQQALDQVLARRRLPRLRGVGVSTFWHSLLGLDRQGRPTTPVLLWMDARSRDQAADLRRRLDARAVHARTGCVLHWSYWPAKLAWLARARPDAVRATARWVSFGEYLLERLTDARPGVSVSMASGTGLLNQHTRDWDGDLIGHLPLETSHLAPVVGLRGEAATLRPAEARRWPALKDVPWIPPVGDGACSNLGAGCATAERMALMIGTSAAERVVWAPGGAFTIPWGAWCYRVDEARLVMGGAMNDGGSLFDWLRRSLRLPPLDRIEAEVAALGPDEHGLTVLPFWAGERSLGWADDARGVVAGLRLHTTPAEVVRAGMEAVGLRFGELDARLRRVLPAGRAAEVVATGGALLHSPAWLQIMADVLGRPVTASPEAEASSRGASLLASETLGLLPTPLERQPAPDGRVYRPVAAHAERYAAAAERQRRLYDLLVAHQDGPRGDA